MQVNDPRAFSAMLKMKFDSEPMSTKVTIAVVSFLYMSFCAVAGGLYLRRNANVMDIQDHVDTGAACQIASFLTLWNCNDVNFYDIGFLFNNDYSDEVLADEYLQEIMTYSVEE